jgi:cell filamentation protein
MQTRKDKLGITNINELKKAETSALTAAFDRLIGMYGPAHRFTSADITAIHKVWLGGIYDWAGEYRQLNATDGEISFASPSQIPRLMEALEKGPLHRNTPCNFMSVDRVIRAVAEVYVELVLIHPFRGGNRRTARVLVSLIASQAGLPVLDFTDMEGKRRDDYTSAINRGLYGDFKPMEELFGQIILRSTRATKRPWKR